MQQLKLIDQSWKIDDVIHTFFMAVVCDIYIDIEGFTEPSWTSCFSNNSTLFHEKKIKFFSNIISLPERRNKRKSVLEITKMYYF